MGQHCSLCARFHTQLRVAPWTAVAAATAFSLRVIRQRRMGWGKKGGSCCYRSPRRAAPAITFSTPCRQLSEQYWAMGSCFLTCPSSPAARGNTITSHSSQGATADRVLVHVDTEQAHTQLINSRLAYVALSRGRYDAEIYTNPRAHRLPLTVHSDTGTSAYRRTGPGIRMPELPVVECPHIIVVIPAFGRCRCGVDRS